MKIAVGADHAGLELKMHLVRHLEAAGYVVDDVGTDDTASCDYPDYAAKVATSVSQGDTSRGLLVCGTGIGMAITANKVAGVRAANCNAPVMARMARAHNDANVLTVGSRIVAADYAIEILNTFLETPFDGGRHERRVGKIMSLDSAGP